MDPITLSALIGLGGSAISGGLNLFSQNKAAGNADAQLQLALQNYNLEKRKADQSYELATAGRSNARGDSTTYVPGRGWVTNLSPTSQSIVNQSDALTQTQNRRAATTGQADVSRNFNRRLTEGSAADPLLAALVNNYGGPTRAGVGGRNLISNVTQAAEGADNVRGGYAGAALRTGQGTVPLALNMQSLDKGGTAGIRSAIAKSDNDTDPLFQSALSQFQQNKLNPYNTLATRASNSGDAEFKPENITGALDTGSLYASSGAAKGAAAGAEGLYRGIAPVLSAYGAQSTPNYDLFAAGVTSNLKNLLRGGYQPEAMANKIAAANKDWSTSSLNDSAYNNWRF